MSSYNPYGSNPPQYPTPQNNIYPQLPVGQQPMGYPAAPGQNPHYPYQPGFNYPYPQPGQPVPGQQAGQPGGPNVYPAAMSYPSAPPMINPTPAYGNHTPPYGNHTPPYGSPTPTYGMQPNLAPSVTPSYSQIDWIPTTPREAPALADRCVVAGYEGHDGSPLWVIRARYQGDLVPGKLAVKYHAAYVPWGGRENSVNNIEVLCARPETIHWVDDKNGEIPAKAIPGGQTSEGETIYIGRAKEQGSLTPGKVHPSHKVMYMSFAGEEIPHPVYQILCTV